MSDLPPFGSVSINAYATAADEAAAQLVATIQGPVVNPMDADNAITEFIELWNSNPLSYNLQSKLQELEAILDPAEYDLLYSQLVIIEPEIIVLA